jgi:hypothetical protein
MVDLGALRCPGGRFARQIDGVDAREDGIHSSPGFAPVVWRYIEARIRPWLAEAAAGRGRGHARWLSPAAEWGRVAPRRYTPPEPCATKNKRRSLRWACPPIW